MTDELVRLRHQPVEHLHRDRHEIGMGDPGAVVAVARLALLVGAHLGEGGVVGVRVALDRNLRRHPAHREGAAAVAGLDQQAANRPLRKASPIVIADRSGVRNAAFLREPLDEGKDIVPAAAVEPDDVVAQFVENLVHFEGGRQRLDQHRRLERAVRPRRVHAPHGRTRRSTAGPRDGSPASADRSRASRPRPSASSRCERNRARNRTASRTSRGRRP